MILGTRSSAPFICGVCGRQADSTGYSEKDSADILWTCRKHVSLGKRVYRMKQGQLSQYENAAVTRAKEECVGDFMLALLDIMWMVDVRDLNKMTSDKVKEVEANAKRSVQIQQIFQKFMSSYSAYLDKIMSGEEPPF
jgi:ABC-type proline/glycine betaine transport system ATPase subunit